MSQNSINNRDVPLLNEDGTLTEQGEIRADFLAALFSPPGSIERYKFEEKWKPKDAE